MASNTRQPLIVETIVPCIRQALRKYWLTSGKGLEGQRPGFCRGHAHILQIAGDLARSAFMAGMSKTEEAEHRKGLTGTGGGQQQVREDSSQRAPVCRDLAIAFRLES